MHRPTGTDSPVAARLPPAPNHSHLPDRQTNRHDGGRVDWARFLLPPGPDRRAPAGAFLMFLCGLKLQFISRRPVVCCRVGRVGAGTLPVATRSASRSDCCCRVLPGRVRRSRDSSRGHALGITVGLLLSCVAGSGASEPGLFPWPRTRRHGRIAGWSDARVGSHRTHRPRRSVPTRALVRPPEALRVRQGGVPNTRLSHPSARAPSAPPHFPAPRPFPSAWGSATTSSWRSARR